MRQLAFDKANEAIEGVDARHWFAVQTGKIDLLKKVEDRLAADLVHRAERLRNQARLGLLLAFSLVAIALLFAFFSIRAIKRPLNQVVQVADRIADGDLVGVFENRFHDEIGQLLRAMQTMQGSLRKTVGNVFAATDTVSAAAAEIRQGNADLSQRTEEQAAALEKTAASMEELTGAAQQSAEHAGQANRLAAAAQA